MKRLTKESVDQINTYISQTKDLLGLKDWNIALHDDQWADDTTAAQCRITFGQQHARLFIHNDFVEATQEEQRCDIVHELIHCHLINYDEAVTNDFLDNVGLRDTLKLAFAKIFNRLLESAVDGIAVAVSKLVPMPTWEALHVEDW